jgi:uncharacterized protein with HEPN domain
MLNAIDRMLGKLDCGREVFERDEMLQVWMIHHMEVLGEAAAALPAHMRTAHPEVPWMDIIGMRNRLVHGYFDVDLGVVWMVVERDLPALREKIERMRNDLSKEDDAT